MDHVSIFLAVKHFKGQIYKEDREGMGWKPEKKSKKKKFGKQCM